MEFVKAQACGNDFLFMEENRVDGAPLDDLARAVCGRRHGVGADGLIVYRRTPTGAAMRLFNADGSPAEVSGNGVRCLGALLVETARGGAPGTGGAMEVETARGGAPGTGGAMEVETARGGAPGTGGAMEVETARGGAPGTGGAMEIQTAGGLKTLTLLAAQHPRYTFRAGMGQPLGLREEELAVGGERVRVVVLSVGNPQCVVLSPSVDEGERQFRRLGRLLATHERFPEGTNVEFATVERPDRLRILIWERGVGPTLASGTGACAAAVAAARFGGAARRVEVVSPGGVQEVDWTEEEIRLTGWADIVARGEWIPPPASL